MTVSTPHNRQRHQNQHYLSQHQPGGLALSQGSAVNSSKKPQRRPTLNITRILTAGLSDLYSSIQQQVKYHVGKFSK